MLWIGVPLVDAVPFVGIVDMPFGVVDRNGLDFPRAAELAEPANLRGGEPSLPVVVQAVLPEIAVARPRFWSDDREDRAVTGATVQGDAHRRTPFTRLPLQHRELRQVGHAGPVSSECEHP